MNKFIKVIKYYTGYPSSRILTKDIFLQISSIESFELINSDLYGHEFTYYYKEREGESGIMHVPTDLVNVLLISNTGEHYFSNAPIEKFFQLQEVDMVDNRFEILDL